jgi:hypothetical protein
MTGREALFNGIHYYTLRTREDKVERMYMSTDVYSSTKRSQAQATDEVIFQ